MGPHQILEMAERSLMHFLIVLALAALADAKCQVGEGLVLCAHLNGKKISTRAAMKSFDSSAQSVFDFLLTNARTRDTPGCRELAQRVACDMNASNGKLDDASNCLEDGVVSAPSRKSCRELVDECGTTLLTHEQCDQVFYDSDL